MRIVLDTNIFVSALISRHGPPAELLDLWNDDLYDLVTSQEQIEELQRVLHYPRIAKHLKTATIRTLLDRIAAAAFVVGDLPAIDLCSDPDDNLILATAVAGAVALVASGDRKHMLPLGNVQGIPILDAAMALAMIRENTP